MRCYLGIVSCGLVPGCDQESVEISSRSMDLGICIIFGTNGAGDDVRPFFFFAKIV